MYSLGVNDPNEGDCPIGDPRCVNSVNNIPCTGAQQTITAGPLTDPYTGNVVKRVSPNGNYFSARVGNADVCAKASQLCSNFTVTSQTAGLTYMYAVVFEDPSHSTAEQPRFQVAVKDAGGNVVNCGNYYFISGPTIPGFQTYSGGYNKSTTVRFKDWTYIGMDLTSYIGQTLSICFETGDCSISGHFGYAYVDATCRPVVPQGFTICTTGSPVQLCAPPGYSGWTWSTGAFTECINVANPSAGDIYSVTAMSVSGCPSISRDTIKLFQADAWGNQTINCNGSVTLNTSANDIVNYSWSSNPPGFMSTDQNPVVSPTVTTTYYVNITPRFSTGGCTVNKQIVITVTPCFSVNVNSGNVCSGNCSTLIATGIGGTAPFTYTWSPGSGSTSAITACPTTTTTYTVTVADNGGLTGTATTVVTVNTLPTITATTAAACIGEYATICASGGTLYTWSTGSNVTCLTVNPTANTQYCVTGADAKGCLNSTCTSVAVYQKPNITASGIPYFICYGQSATLTAIGGNTYTWTPGSFNGSTVVITPNANITYTVTGTDGNGCTNLDTAVVLVNPPINAGISGTDEICGNKNGRVCTTPNGGTPGYTYTWNTAGSTLCLDSLHAGTFTVTVKDSKGCITIRTVGITNQIINPSGIPSADKYFDVITHKFLFDWNGNYGYKYDWDFGDTTAHSNLKNPIHTYKHKGVYTVVLIVTSPDGCVSEYTFTIEVVIPTKLEVFNVFTPDNDGFNDKYRVKYEGDFLFFRMLIFNRWGKKLFETNDIDEGWDGSRISDGTYYYIISAKGKDMVEYEFHGHLTLIR